MVDSIGSGSRDGATSEKSRGRGGGDGGSSAQEMKKGPWTAAEDAILVEYVRKHGEGNWNAVQRNSGLQRCGKSCRLRWANHLRPNLKKGAFSPEEERLIIELHSKLGNKWARMASQLPGRTDNEIKNFWNTRLKRLQRAGLPIYPNDIPPLYDQTRPNSTSPPPFSSLLSSSSSSNCSNSPFDPFNFPAIANPFQPATGSSFLSNSHHRFKLFNDNGSNRSFVGLPLTSSSSLFNPRYQRELSPAYQNQIQFKSAEFGDAAATTMGGSGFFSPVGLVPDGMETELPLIQPPVLAVGPPDSSGSNGGDYMMEAPSDADEYCSTAPQVVNSGLLDALLEESKTLVHAGKDKPVIRAGEDTSTGLDDSSSPLSSVGE
ncbi:hypothetical protein U1Q18_048697 [Sarracenia purpurea var. burkii]